MVYHFLQNGQKSLANLEKMGNWASYKGCTSFQMGFSKVGIINPESAIEKNAKVWMKMILSSILHGKSSSMSEKPLLKNQIP